MELGDEGIVAYYHGSQLDVSLCIHLNFLFFTDRTENIVIFQRLPANTLF